MSRSKIFFSAILLVMLVGPMTAMAAETKDGKPAAAAPAGEPAPECHKRYVVKGHAKKILSIARLSAVRSWTEMAMNHGKEYGMWHYAKGQNIKCRRLPGAEYYLCFATGKPCRAVIDGKTASNKTN